MLRTDVLMDFWSWMKTCLFGRYVRIGNGNKLVRDPKRRTRLLASEKVRWSLHTARMRLAKKRKFCQFFTRFGKCNKGEGKCPYIHDPSKIAVCTKFLNGLCGDPSCKLTHKVWSLNASCGLCHIFSSCSWLKTILVIVSCAGYSWKDARLFIFPARWFSVVHASFNIILVMQDTDVLYLQAHAPMRIVHTDM